MVCGGSGAAQFSKEDAEGSGYVRYSDATLTPGSTISESQTFRISPPARRSKGGGVLVVPRRHSGEVVRVMGERVDDANAAQLLTVLKILRQQIRRPADLRGSDNERVQEAKPIPVLEPDVFEHVVVNRDGCLPTASGRRRGRGLGPAQAFTFYRPCLERHGRASTELRAPAWCASRRHARTRARCCQRRPARSWSSSRTA
jgi:hypothetical protein